MASRVMMLVLVAGLTVLCGCQGLNRVFYQAGARVEPRAAESRVMLVAGFAFTNQEDGDAEEPATDGDDADDPADEDERPVRRRFTVPSEAVRQLTLLAAATARVSPDDEDEVAIGGAGKEIAEALAGGATPFVGQPGLSAPQPTVAGVVVSRPGLQQGPASGLGFASPFNILTPQTNPASGSLGRCTDLTRAGFFGGSTSACQAHFQRQTRFRFVPKR